MSKNLNTTAGLAAEWTRIKEQVTGEKAPQALAPFEAKSSLSTTAGLKAAWEHAKQAVTNPGQAQTKRPDLRAKVAQLREFDPESADAIERELDRLDSQD